MTEQELRGKEEEDEEEEAEEAVNKPGRWKLVRKNSWQQAKNVFNLLGAKERTFKSRFSAEDLYFCVRCTLLQEKREQRVSE